MGACRVGGKGLPVDAHGLLFSVLKLFCGDTVRETKPNQTKNTKKQNKKIPINCAP